MPRLAVMVLHCRQQAGGLVLLLPVTQILQGACRLWLLTRVVLQCVCICLISVAHIMTLLTVNLAVPADEQGGEGDAEEAKGKGVHDRKDQHQDAEEPEAMELIRSFQVLCQTAPQSSVFLHRQGETGLEKVREVLQI